MNLEDPYEGQKFSSFEVLKKYLEEYGKRNFVKFWIRSSHTINSFKSKTTKKLNPDLKYVCMRFACIFGGEKTRCRGSGIRKSTTYRNLGCPCTISAVVGEDGNHVKLETVILEHNHALGKSLFDALKKSKSKIKMLQSEIIRNNLCNMNVGSERVNLSAKTTQDSTKSDVISEVAQLPPINDNDLTVKTESEKEVASERTNFQSYVKEIQQKYGNNIKIIVVKRDESEKIQEETKNEDENISEDLDEEQVYNLKQGNEESEDVGLPTVKEICRLCLSTSNKLNPIFKPSLPLESTILSFKIMSCASIEISNNDELPCLICTTCEEILDIAYNFRIRCENSDSVLREVYSSSRYIDLNGISKKYVEDNEEEEEEEKCEDIKLDEDKVIEYAVNMKTEESALDFNKDVTYDAGNEVYAQFDDTCPICGNNFETYPDMLRHLEEHSDIENFLLTCNLCSVIFSTVKSLTDHMNEHMIEDNWSNRLTASSDNFLSSEDAKPPEDNVQMKITEPYGLEVDKGNSSNGFLCNVCGKILKSKDRFQSHRNTHEGLRPHICMKCGRGFADRKNMHQHYDIVHLRKAKHECPICHKKFYAPTKMKSHITMHYGVKPFACDVCNKTFRLRMNMVKHKKTHSNERPHKCDKCKAAFIDKNLLTRHSYVHGGVRPHVCPYCGHRFTLKFNLKKHMISGKCYGRVKDKDNSEYSWENASQIENCVPNKESIIKCEKSDFTEENESSNIDILQEYGEKN